MKKEKLLSAASVFFLLAALLVVAYNLWDDHRAGNAAETALNELKETISAPAPTGMAEELPQSPETDGGEKSAASPDAGLLPEDAWESAAEEAAAENLPAGEEKKQTAYIGVLSVPEAGLELPIYGDYSEENLKNSPCRYLGSPEMDNMVIAGHNYAHHFTPLKRLEPGAELRFTDLSGVVYVYQVSAVEIVGPEDVENMTTGDWDLTLFTCTLDPPPRNRYTIRCVRLS